MSWFHVHHHERADISISGELGVGATADDLIAQCRDAEALRVAINCFGGDSHAGLALHDFFAARDTVVEIGAVCGSSAMFAAMGARRIIASPDSRILVHAPSAFVLGEAEELFWNACKLEGMTARLIEIFTRRTSQPRETVCGWFRGDNWFSASEALAAGLIDEIRQEATAPAPAIATPRAPGRPAKPESQRMFEFWLAAFGKIEVRDREEFARDLIAWAQLNTNQPTP